VKTNTLVKGKKVLNDIQNMKTIGELIDYIPKKHIQRIAFAILILWTCSPIFVMIYGSFARLYDDPDWLSKLNQMYKMTINWYRILLQLGLSGCLIGLLAFLKSLKNAKKDEFHAKTYIKERLIKFSLLSMLIWSFLSFLFSDNLALSLFGGEFKKEGFATFVAVAGIFSCAYIIKDEKYSKWIIEIFTAVTVLQSILMLINVDAINKQLGFSDNASVYLNINHFAYILCMAAMSALLLYENESKSKLRTFGRLLMFAIIIAALVRNRSLGPYLATLCAIISSIILAIWLNKSRLRKLIIALVVFFLVTFIMNLSDGHLYIDLKIFGFELFQLIEGSEDLSHIGSGRWELWGQGLQYMSERPILGCGPGLLSDLYFTESGNANRPHNEFIEYAATIGIPGVLFYISALFIYLKKIIKKRRELSSFSIGLLCIVIAYLVSSLFGVVIYNVSPYFFMFFGLSIGVLRCQVPVSK